MQRFGALVFFILLNTECFAQNMLSMTSKALLSYERVEERADYFVMRVKNATFGEDTDKILMFAPFITGKLQFMFEDVQVYVDAHDEESGIKYTYNF